MKDYFNLILIASNFVLNNIILYFHPFRRTEWNKDFSKYYTYKIWVAIITICPFPIFYFVLNSLFKSYKEELKKEETKNKIQNKILSNRKM
jgi:phosphotransferase system  glucose/maltose/N-acetylglucosamine-specific IIC component